MNPQDVRASLEAVRRRIADAERRYGRAPGTVSLLAVSKGVPTEGLRFALQAQQQRFGESYLQEALAKIQELAGLGIEWHFIGILQSNKTRAVAERFDWVHSLDRPRVARRLSEQRPPGLPPLNVCLEVNVSGEAGKGGVAPFDLLPLAEEVASLPRLMLRGLMALPAPTDAVDAQRRAFRRVYEAQESLRQQGFDLDTLSMGMSHDLEAAIAEGATLVRVGTAIFGPRTRL